MFACFPRTLRKTPNANAEGSIFDVRILERHPYTTQTFIPLGVSPSDPSTQFLVIVAPSLPSTIQSIDGKEEVQRPPDLENLKAFICKGDQAVTYGAGTWHAPMVVLGRRRVDFVVLQFVNGVGDVDCQEVVMGEGVEVAVGDGGGVLAKL